MKNQKKEELEYIAINPFGFCRDNNPVIAIHRLLQNQGNNGLGNCITIMLWVRPKQDKLTINGYAPEGANLLYSEYHDHISVDVSNTDLI